jgi:hypothetical protein
VAIRVTDTYGLGMREGDSEERGKSFDIARVRIGESEIERLELEVRTTREGVEVGEERGLVEILGCGRVWRGTSDGRLTSCEIDRLGSIEVPAVVGEGGKTRVSEGERGNGG